MLIRALRSARVPIPHEPSEWMVFRRLNSRRLQDAADAKGIKAQKRAAARQIAIGPEVVKIQREEAERVAALQAKALEAAKASLGPEAMKQIQDATIEAAKAAMAATPDAQVLERYDRDTLLRLGIHEWSYSDPPSAVFVDNETDDIENDSGVDEKTADWAYRQILVYNELLPKEADEALGN